MTSLTDRNATIVRDTLSGNPPGPPPLEQNRMRLFSYYKPGLEAGNYHIEAEQRITSQSYSSSKNPPHVWESATKRVFNKVPGDTAPDSVRPVLAQDFQVMAPQFSLEREMINSYYPPEGHQDEGRILPHIVLNDPHFPWERDAGTFEAAGAVNHESIGSMKDPDLDKAGHQVSPLQYRSKVPWIALLVFDPAELKISAAEANTLSMPAYSGAEAKDIADAPSTGAFEMQVKQYLSIAQKNRINFEVGLSEETDELNGDDGLLKETATIQAIFPTKGTFKAIFPDAAHLEANKYLAHVRAVNTIGFPDAGTEMLGNYSIVISARIANLNINEPTTQLCHLVSIEHVDSTIQSAPYTGLADTERIGIVSLFSWTYTALPPNPINFVDSIEHVVEGMQMLRAPEIVLKNLREQVIEPRTTDVTEQKGIASVYQRLSAGYTLSRWRCESGEETAAFSRGPLVPEKLYGPPVDDWPTGSNNSKEYQVLDRASGLMDLSYSSAWQLGKTLAIADTVFNAALMRFRSLVYTWAADKARLQKDNITSREGLAIKLANDIRIIGGLSAGNAPDPRRVVPSTGKDLPPNSVGDPSLRPLIAAKIREAVATQASGTGGDIWKAWSLDKPKNSDWPIISTWISNKLSLMDIPAHYLIPDPSYLPDESLRFFHIDDTWMDCIVDGALSVANHLDRDDDLVRTYIKQVYNQYLDSEMMKPDGTSSGLKPQIPCYGFVLRSQILKVMPDIRITVDWWKPKDEAKDADQRASVCRYTKLDDITLLALLDRQPEELESIILAQPPHQQRFSLGYALHPDVSPEKSSVEFKFRQLYTVGAQMPMDTIWPLLDGEARGRHDEWYNWDSRMVQVDQLAKDVNAKLQLDSNAYQDYVPTSAELAMELNDPSYFFSILPRPKPDAKREKVARRRQLRTKEGKWKAEPPPPVDEKSSSTPLGGPEPPGLLQPGEGGAHIGSSPAKFGGSNGVVISKEPPPAVLPFDPRAAPKGVPKLTCFALNVYADYKGLPKKWPRASGLPGFDDKPDENDYLPTKNDYLYDLIFSVQKLPARKGENPIDYTLQEILIIIPHTASGKDPDSSRDPRQQKNYEPLCEASYADPRARMLSNQRFVVFLNNTKTNLQVRIVPRSATMFPTGKQVPASMSIGDSRSDDLSFRLAEVPVPQVLNVKRLLVHGKDHFDRPGGVVKVQMFEMYFSGGKVYSVPSNPCYVYKLDQGEPGT
ncbi:hypothetical protein TI39_contig350g00005 [Zymoseptoria brevis]|uniref:Uncharacterized protein n=1 Tax=Zymoseptoria brevis TaxID=1047168 RepID=A0A0F4GR08_9PEZI|nr:hypothetical protein TI39_contig350g00005 [Zymoseptoria brevis]